MKLTQAEVKRRFRYESETGYLIKLSTMKRAGKYNGIHYPKIVINGTHYMIHHLVWLYHTGELPNEVIDHIDRNKQNSRFENLRLSSNRNNGFNKDVMINNTSGVTGVSIHKSSNKWQAFLKDIHGVKHIGLFSDFADAVRARYVSELKSKYHYINNNSSAKAYLISNDLLNITLHQAITEQELAYVKEKKRLRTIKEQHLILLAEMSSMTDE